MSSAQNNNDPFYIGWQDQAPQTYAVTTRNFILTVLVVFVSVVSALVISQRGFDGSVFELGKISTLEGVLIESPAPILQIKENGKRKGVLLVGFGKHGAEATLQVIETEIGKQIVGKRVKLAGTLIYYQGKMVMELTEGSKAFRGFSEDDSLLPTRLEQKQFGEVSLMGEILDPKCALGVMKPGYGKPHRSCAVRCLSGGITPIFRLRNNDGESNYCILKGANGEKINASILPYVADQLRLCGRLEQQDDWLVFYLNPAEDILRLKPHWVKGEIPMCADPLGLKD